MGREESNQTKKSILILILIILISNKLPFWYARGLVPAESTIKICFKATRRLQSCENLHFLPPQLMCHSYAWCCFDHECSTIFSKCKRAELHCIKEWIEVLFESKSVISFFCAPILKILVHLTLLKKSMHSLSLVENGYPV